MSRTPSRQDPHRRARILAALRAKSLTAVQIARALRERVEHVRAHLTRLASAKEITAVGEVVDENGRRHKQWMAA